MNLTKTFGIEKDKAGRIPTFFNTVGYKLEKSLSGHYRFKRGSGWSRLYANDIKKLPTTVEVNLAEAGDKFQIFVNYDIDTRGVIATAGDRRTIEGEMENLEAFVKAK